MKDEELRSYFAQDEVCVLAVGWFYLFFGGLIASCSSLLLLMHFDKLPSHYNFMLFLGVVLGAIYIMLGWGMRHFDPWSRAPARFAAFVMLFLFPLGTLAGLFCYVLLRERSHETIFTNQYRALLLMHPQLERHTTLLPTFIGLITGLTLYFVGHNYGAEIIAMVRQLY